MRVQHSCLSCFWKESLRPLFFTGERWECHPPQKWSRELKYNHEGGDITKIEPDMAEVLKYFTFDNTEEFMEWIEHNYSRDNTRDGQGLQIAMHKWRKYIKKNGESAPMPGPIFEFLAIALPVAGVIVGGAIFGLGVVTCLRWLTII